MRFFHVSKKRIFFSSVIAILIFISILVGCNKKDDSLSRIYFKHCWQWIQGEDDGSIPETLMSGENFKLLETSAENDLRSLIPDSTGYIWVRAEFQVPEDLQDITTGILSKRILYTGSIYVNGNQIGQLGSLPPNQFLSGYKTGGFYIPETILNKTGKNVLAIKIWVEALGCVPSTIYFGSYDEISYEAEKSTFFCSTINFSFSFSLILISLLYIFFYVQRKFKEYLLHAMLNLFSAIFLTPFFQDQFTFMEGLFPSYLVFCKFFYAIPAYISAYFASSYMREFLHEKDSRNLNITRLAILVIPIIITLSISDLVSLMKAQPVLILFIGAQIYFGIESVFKSLLKNQKEVYVLIAGFSPVIVAIPLDVVIHSIFHLDNVPFLTILGWQGVILAFMFILSFRYNEIFKRVEYLNTNLEKEVEERTIRLSESNEKLENEKKQTKADMDFAVHVQEAFFKQPDFKIDGWDLAMKTRPATGISGDMFDVYHIGNVLEGISLFDVSGHGIAAGLVTMLCKNIIAQNFRDGLYSGETHENLSVVMENINRGVITAKGDIENYLTGLLLRVDNAPEGATCHAELTNAGSPIPLLYTHKTKKCTEIKTKIPSIQYGMIGIRGLEVSFPTQHFEIAPEDALVLYTDGITEAVNSSGEQFGRERLSKAIANAGSTSAQTRLNSIMNELQTFAEGVPYDDDITLIILQRKKI
ncbi:MAG: SpoIIE family protein phosphatase [Treponemataceae bacterium]|nr:SpoIIE family protein phosphatase [Treponemataceae bacterium]